MVTYHVKPGDNLTKIANRLGVTIQQLKSWNHLANDGHNRLQPGEALRVYIASSSQDSNHGI